MIDRRLRVNRCNVVTLASLMPIIQGVILNGLGQAIASYRPPVKLKSRRFHFARVIFRLVHARRTFRFYFQSFGLLVTVVRLATRSVVFNVGSWVEVIRV